MKKHLYQAACLLLLSVVVFSACKKKDDPDPGQNPPPTVNGAGSVSFEFENTVNGFSLSLNSDWYLNDNGDSFQVTKLSYYISNIKLHDNDGKVYAVPESYYLLQQEDPGSLSFTLNDIPEGNYTSVSFLIGVDSIRNVSGAQTGALDPVHGMFWDWNTGYIMAKFEANSPQSPNNGKIMYHIGGFSGTFNPIKQVSLALPVDMSVSDNIAVISVEADLAEWFRDTPPVDFSVLHTIHMPNASSKRIADNYADMFQVRSVVYSVE